jgi:hypothetical protein
VLIRWTQLSRLSGVEWRLLAEATGWLALVRLGLWCLPFRTTWSVCRRLGRKWREGPRRPPERRFEEAVRRACRLVPSSTCLTRALALSIMLRRSGYHCEVRLGATRDGGQFLAHAWVERAGAVAHEAARRYSVFPSLGDFPG